jgi:hypothetical protein
MSQDTHHHSGQHGANRDEGVLIQSTSQQQQQQRGSHISKGETHLFIAWLRGYDMVIAPSPNEGELQTTLTPETALASKQVTQLTTDGDESLAPLSHRLSLLYSVFLFYSRLAACATLNQK